MKQATKQRKTSQAAAPATAAEQANSSQVNTICGHPVPPGHKAFKLSTEAYRDYTWLTPFGPVTHRIVNPMLLVIRDGGSTHRVIDALGLVHLVPSVGTLGCVVMYQARTGQPAISF